MHELTRIIPIQLRLLDLLIKPQTLRIPSMVRDTVARRVRRATFVDAAGECGVRVLVYCFVVFTGDDGEAGDGAEGVAFDVGWGVLVMGRGRVKGGEKGYRSEFKGGWRRTYFRLAVEEFEEVGWSSRGWRW
jgi:hypothetical protein